MKNIGEEVMSRICLYHSGCNDGLCAAGVVYSVYQNAATEYVPVQYNDKDIPSVEDKDVVFVDFCYPLHIMKYIAKEAKSLIVLDHHISAEKTLKYIEENYEDVTISFNKELSGAEVTWEFYYKDTPVPEVVALVGDRDLWQFRLEDTHAFYAGSREGLLEPEDYSDLLFNKERLSEIISDGRIIDKYQKTLVKAYEKRKPRMATVAGHLVPYFPCTHLVSEVGNIACKGYPFSCTYFDIYDRRIFSLRSDENGLDVSKIAESFGGGGHEHAAGFSLALGEYNLDENISNGNLIGEANGK
jgi:oligoribonuclease NrnB/cAMP/cGMP phosphodiesterase (DHH superfamily)